MAERGQGSPQVKDTPLLAVQLKHASLGHTGAGPHDLTGVTHGVQTTSQEPSPGVPTSSWLQGPAGCQRPWTTAPQDPPPPEWPQGQLSISGDSPTHFHVVDFCLKSAPNDK